ncbi:uncharacterized protein LOC119986170 [Tripterygium wilfordii]|uniref:uncharacterized protein LOC119986170 n=1 Tax=Tripterygium wilfordii TaxID=458696 RepID=UPI0018F83D57|nr:uncharacterized protein LOC119986170 [Tripterygium wilfordii]
MTKIGVMVCVLIVIMDVVASILGIEAEIDKNKVIRVRMNAYKLGLVAASLLGFAHIGSNLLGGCICINCMQDLERVSASRQLWFVCLVSSWIIAAIGFAGLIMGILEKLKSISSMIIKHHHLLFIGGVSCFIHAMLSVAL